MIQAVCEEKGGPVLRTVKLMPRDPWMVREVVKKMRTVPNFLDKKNPYEVLLDPDVTPMLVDDVGIIFLKSDGGSVETHITFWDRRLRGREELCKAVVDYVLQDHGSLWTAIPKDSKVVRAFAERIGFEPIEEKGGAIVYVMGRNNGT